MATSNSSHTTWSRSWEHGKKKKVLELVPNKNYLVVVVDVLQLPPRAGLGLEMFFLFVCLFSF